MRHLGRSLALFGALGASAACLVIVSTGPSALVGPPALVLRPAHLVPVPGPGGACPFIHPFAARIIVIFGDAGDHDLELDEVSMRFVDRRGVDGAAGVFDRRVLRDRFGSVVLRDHREGGFAFAFGFGCGTLATGNIFISVRLRGRDGRTHDAGGSVQVNQN
ncbi:MAG: hypothetical protein ACRD09_12060 [Vicinamibacterales bacterium]